MARRTTLLLALAGLCCLPLTQASPTDGAPLTVVAVQTGETVKVVWLPSQGMPDSFHVYGVSNAGFALLSTIAGDAPPEAVVPAGYPAYAVSAESNGAESAPSTIGVSVSNEWPICLDVNPWSVPPQVFILCI